MKWSTKEVVPNTQLKKIS